MKIKISLTLMAFTLLSLAIAGILPSNSMEKYRVSGQNLVKKIKGGASGQMIRLQSRELLEQGVAIAQNYLQRYPQCGDYLKGTIAAKERMPQMTVQQIEQDYHADGALPKAPDHCYDVKDLVVHPATVMVVLQQQGDGSAAREKMSDELEEVLDHLDNVADKL